MDGVKIQLKEDETDVICEKCGRKMVVKVGRYGKFLACPGYPECKNVKKIVNDTGAECPKCGGKVVAAQVQEGPCVLRLQRVSQAATSFLGTRLPRRSALSAARR